MHDESVYHAAVSQWRVIAASAVGTGHISNSQPCQDAFSISIPVEGWLLAVLADGAGSAVCGGIGAKAIAEGATAHIANVIRQQNPKGLDNPISFWRPHVEAAIEFVRSTLERAYLEQTTSLTETETPIEIEDRSADDARPLHSEPSEVLKKFHATVVGAIISEEGGVFFHIGDGTAVATCAHDLSEYIITEPRNGETADQTYFFTESDWRDNLRFVDFGPEHDLFVLLSDGAMTFAMAPHLEGLSPSFIRPITKYLLSETNLTGAIALQNTLDSQATREITTDDKTMIWACRRTLDL